MAVGPIENELVNIRYARGLFANNQSFRLLCKAFISVNSMSLVVYPVGQHNDHFNENAESLENKITFVNPSISGSVRRGGAPFQKMALSLLC